MMEMGFKLLRCIKFPQTARFLVWGWSARKWLLSNLLRKHSGKMSDDLVKKRTRIKIRQELIDEEDFGGRKGVSDDDDDTGTYDVPKCEENATDDEMDGHVLNEERAVPIPAPRRVRDEAIEDQAPPQPLPRRSTTVEQDIPLSDKARKKKKKAAEVIAYVLKRESKKAPRVATVSLDADDRDLQRDDGDVGSPWDSPPAPKNLEKVYIQNKYGFSVRDWCDFYKNNVESYNNPRNRCAVDVALAFHNLWSRLSIFSHGVVAGIAGCHALAVAAALASTQSHVPEFVQFYHFLSLKIHFAVYVFTTLCIVSCLDRLDVGQFSKQHLRAVGQSHGTLLLTFGYVLCLALSLAAHRHTAAIEAYSADNSLWDPQGLYEWTCLVTTRDILLLFCWIFMSCSQPSDLLQEKLNDMTNAEDLSKANAWKLNA